MLNESEVKIWYVAESGNTKTGKTAVTYTTPNSCPDCPLKEKGCYAKNFPCCLQWKKAETKGVRPEELANVISNNVKSEVIRHNVAGDIAMPGTNDINESLVNNLVKAYKVFKKAYTYTHCVISKRNIEIVKNAMKENFVINFSTQTIEDVKKCLAAGVNAVIAVHTMSAKTVKKDGIKLVQCPATYNKNIHCVNCGLCAKKRDYAIVFPVHGNGKNKAIKAGFLTDI